MVLNWGRRFLGGQGGAAAVVASTVILWPNLSSGPVETRVTQAGAEPVTQSGEVRITQQGVEPVTQSGEVRISQFGVEVVTQSKLVRISQFGVETVTQDGGVRVTQVGAEAIFSGDYVCFGVVVGTPTDGLPYQPADVPDCDGGTGERGGGQTGS